METPMIDYDWDRLDGLGFAEDAREELKKACWKGYEAIGVKKKNGRTVPNCVPIKKKKDSSDHGEFDLNKPNELDDMAIGNALPKEPGTGPAKNPQMKEAGIRMPRMEEIVKSSNRNGHLAMAAAPNYAESEDFSDRFDSDEPNARMLITQLRVMREKIDIMLGMMYPDDNFEPWVATKIANAGVAVASVADYLRFGGET
jgi:hypothetical protein